MIIFFLQNLHIEYIKKNILNILKSIVCSVPINRIN